MRNMPPDGERGTETNSGPKAAAALLRPSDAELITAWGSSLLVAGWAPPSVERAQKSLRTFARRLPDGLLMATRDDVGAFFKDRQDALHRRQESAGVVPV